VKTGRIPVMNDGTRWRPFTDVRDAAEGVVSALTARASKINGRIINLGSDAQNLTFADLAEALSSSLSGHPGLKW